MLRRFARELLLVVILLTAVAYALLFLDRRQVPMFITIDPPEPRENVRSWQEIGYTEGIFYAFRKIRWDNKVAPPTMHYLIRWGQQYAHADATMDVSVHSFSVGYVLAAVLFIPVIRAIRRGRRPQGHCVHCGYDLRATPARCPECGAIPNS